MSNRLAEIGQKRLALSPPTPAWLHLALANGGIEVVRVLPQRSAALR